MRKKGGKEKKASPPFILVVALVLAEDRRLS